MNADILKRALALESRSFIEYMAHTAPPVDIHLYPEVRQGLEEIHADEEAMVDELAAAIIEAGGDPDVTATYELHFAYYNFVSTAYSLKVVQEQLEKSLARFDALVDEAAADPQLHDFMRGLRDRKANALAKVAELRKVVAAGPRKGGAAAPAEAAPSAAAPAPAHGAAAYGH